MTCACGCRDTIIEEKEAMTDKTELEAAVDVLRYGLTGHYRDAFCTILASHAALTEALHQEEKFIRQYPADVEAGRWEAVARLLSGKCRDLERKAKATNEANAALTERVAVQRSLLNQIHNFMCGSRPYETVFGAKARTALKDTQ